MSTQPTVAGVSAPAAAAAPMPSIPGTAWDSCAERYDVEATHITGPHSKFALEEVIRLQAGQGKKLSIADIACGSGVLALMAAPRPEIDSILASDYSAGMCAVVERKAKELAAANATSGSSKSLAPIRTLVADAQDLSAIPDNSVDATICVFALMMMPNSEKAAREMVRITKPGGLIVVVTWAIHTQSQFHGLMFNLGKFMAAKKAADNPAAASQPPARSIASIPFATFESHQELYSKLGLETVSISHYSAAGRPYIGAADYWESRQNVSPMFHKTDERDVQLVNEFVDSMWGSKTIFTLTGTSIVGIARKPL